MPNIWELYEEHRRTIERRTEGRWNAVVEPREEEKEKIAGMIASYISEGFAIVNANNHYEGSAPLTVKSLRELLDSA